MSKAGTLAFQMLAGGLPSTPVRPQRGTECECQGRISRQPTDTQVLTQLAEDEQGKCILALLMFGGIALPPTPIRLQSMWSPSSVNVSRPTTTPFSEATTASHAAAAGFEAGINQVAGCCTKCLLLSP